MVRRLAIVKATGSGKTDWLRAGLNTSKPMWGFVKGIQVGISPASIEDDGDGGPRGLLRIGYPIREQGSAQGLINFIAIEPTVAGRRGFSELERSGRDNKPGKVIWSGAQNHPFEGMDRGTLTHEHGLERLSVTLYFERFENGAIPILDLGFRSDRPDEVVLTTRSAPGSATMETSVLTATMGNYARLRRLWLRDDIYEPNEMWPGFQGAEFTTDAFCPADRLAKTVTGDLIVCATSNEKHAASEPGDPNAPRWRYRGSFPVTQYWLKQRGHWDPNLRVRVNGRRLYWRSHQPIPNGLAFENFELVEPYEDWQRSVFGVSRKGPLELVIEKVDR